MASPTAEAEVREHVTEWVSATSLLGALKALLAILVVRIPVHHGNPEIWGGGSHQITGAASLYIRKTAPGAFYCRIVRVVRRRTLGKSMYQYFVYIKCVLPHVG